jgi:hypothetical protein
MITISICAVIAAIALLKIAIEFEKTREVLEDIGCALSMMDTDDNR